jgi:hypothetical protein
MSSLGFRPPLLEELYRLRGELVSEATRIESWLERAFAAYYGLDGDEHFIRGVLAPLRMTDKIQHVDMILKEHGIETYFQGYVARLRVLNEHRNEVAHSHVSVVHEVPRGEEDLEQLLDEDLEQLLDLLKASSPQVLVSRLSRAGLSTDEANLDETRLRLRSLGQTKRDTLRFVAACRARHSPDGGSVENAIREFDERAKSQAR